MSLSDRIRLTIVVASVGVLGCEGQAPPPPQPAPHAVPDKRLATPKPGVAAAVPQPAGPPRLKLDSLRPVMSGLVVPQSIGKVWFTNASPRVGVVCVQGTAVNEKTRQAVKSLPACAPVAAYASAVNMEVMFAGRELAPVCPDSNACRLVVDDAPEAPTP